MNCSHGRAPRRTVDYISKKPKSEEPAESIQTETINSGLKIIRRESWTVSEVSDPSNVDPMGPITKITIHHDGMPPKRMDTHAFIKDRISLIRYGHIVNNHWADIGYHYIIDPLGRIWEGRPLKYQGAHVKDFNEGNIGILVLGNFEIYKPTDEAMSKLFSFIQYLMEKYHIDRNHVYTHRELSFQGKCPGRYLQHRIYMARIAGGPLSR